MKFKTDFYRMRLTCGGKEVQPIHPGKAATVVNAHNAFVNLLTLLTPHMWESTLTLLTRFNHLVGKLPWNFTPKKNQTNQLGKFWIQRQSTGYGPTFNHISLKNSQEEITEPSRRPED